MKTKLNHTKLQLITLGCSKNLVDSEHLLKQLQVNNFSVAHNTNDPADVVIINTCGFIADAKEESIDTILQYIDAKKKGLIKAVYVMGCLSQRYKKELQEEMKEVDGYYGVNDIPKIVEDLGARYRKELIGERFQTTPKHYAYLKISEGCDRSCSFCAIPLIRGKHQSKTMEAIIHEARLLVDNGVKEIILIAQDLTYYGLDIYHERKLAELLELLAAIPGLQWIRLHYAYPTDFPVEILEVINKHDNICNYIDIPLQHFSAPILKAMRRWNSPQQIESLIQNIREKIPGVVIRTTFIVGFPNESIEDFEKLIEFVKKTKFDRLGVFTYSEEEDTRASRLEETVDEQTKTERMELLMSVQEQISNDINQLKVGKSLKTLIDREEGDFFVGRTEYDSPEVDNEVLIQKNDTDIRIGEFYDVKIISAGPFDLMGIIEAKN